jgi:RNA polymerase sigma-70 factor (ECF subfamily)
MADPLPFQDLIRRLRAGDERAAEELLREYGPAVQRAVQRRLGDTRLGRVLDAEDVCQSVMGSFFRQAVAGHYELEQPDQLVKLLTVMARNKVADQVRRQRAQCRDNRRVVGDTPHEDELLGSDPTPSQQASARELFSEFRRRLSPEEWQLLELRQQGLDWTAIAARLNGHADALRKKLTRALDRVADELGLEGGKPG